MLKPLVTIGMPAFNAENTIRAAIASIIFQTYDQWELIIIDDGSVDRTLNIMREFADDRIKIVSDQTNRGISFRLNQMISMAKGKYFCRMDADDIAFFDRLEKQVAFLEANPNTDLLATSVLLFRNNGSSGGVIDVCETHAKICKQPWRGFYFPHPTWMGKLDWFKRHLYAEDANGAEDQLLLYSTFHNSNFAGMKDVLLAYREDSRNFSKIFSRRIVFWRALSICAIKKGDFGDLLFLSLLQPLKIIGDFINLKLNVKCARNKLITLNPLVKRKWELLQKRLTERLPNNAN